MISVRALPAEEKLLTLLNLAHPDAAALREIGELASDPALDWEKLFALSELNAVSPLSLKRLTSEGLTTCMAPGLLTRWETRVAPVRARNEQRVIGAGKLLSAMGQAGIQVIVLKGSMFAEEIYGDPGYKKMNDVDVLVQRKDAERAIEVLRASGFESVGALFGRKDLSSSSHHTPPFVSADLGCVVGLHWGLTSPLAPWRPEIEGIWRRKVGTTVAGARAFRMTWEDNLVHLCLHLPFFKTGLRELADVYNLVLTAGTDLDWEAVAGRARRWKAEDPLYRVLKLTDALVDLGIDPRLWRIWEKRSSRFSRRDTELRLRNPAAILHSRSTQAARIEKAYAVFMLSENYSERLKAWAGMWAFLGWPKESELRKLAADPALAPGMPRLTARLRAPWQLWNAMARDHGHLPLAAMTAANAAILARASARKALRPSRDGRSLREHRAAKLLEVLE